MEYQWQIYLKSLWMGDGGRKMLRIGVETGEVHLFHFGLRKVFKESSTVLALALLHPVAVNSERTGINHLEQLQYFQCHTLKNTLKTTPFSEILFCRDRLGPPQWTKARGWTSNDGFSRQLSHTECQIWIVSSPRISYFGNAEKVKDFKNLVSQYCYI